MIDPETLKKARKAANKKLKEIAEEICSVQPMPNNLFSELMKYAKEENKLIEEGYESASKDTKLMWIKKEK